MALDEATRGLLRHAAARLWFKVLAPEEAIGLIEDLAADGLWHDAFFAVLDAPPVLREVSQPFLASLETLGVAIGSAGQALEWLCQHHLGAMLRGRAEPCDALVHLIEIDLQHDYRGGTMAERFAGDADLVALLALHQQYDYFLAPYDDIWHSPQERAFALADLRRRIVAAAQRWRAHHPESLA